MGVKSHSKLAWLSFTLQKCLTSEALRFVKLEPNLHLAGTRIATLETSPIFGGGSAMINVVRYHFSGNEIRAKLHIRNTARINFLKKVNNSKHHAPLPTPCTKPPLNS